MNIYKFAKTAVEKKPKTATTALLEKAMRTKRLTRAEKNRIAETLYGMFSPQNATYKLLGWAWNMRACMKRFLVSYKYESGTFHTYYAPDKTSLRKVLSSVSEIIEAPKPKE
jgi:hypothetical protein